MTWPPKLCADVPPRGSVILEPEVIHLLSNHLAVIVGFVELLIADAPPDAANISELVEVRAAAMAAADLISRATPTS
jgi:hypothetical protein